MKTFGIRQNQVLTEVYRRLNFFKKGNLDAKTLMLSTPSQMKIIKKFDLLKPSYGESKCCANWYCLTEKGKKFFINYIRKISSMENQRLCTKKMIEFDRSLLED
jgi:hypothetical protein